MEHIRNLMTRGLTRRTFLAGLGATAALPLLAACQPEVVEVEKEVVVTQIVEKVVEVEKMMEAGVVDLPNFAGDPKIRYVTWSVDGDKAYNDIIYEKTGVVCSVEPMEGGAEKLLTQVAGGVGPDVLFVDAYWQGDFFRKGLSQDFEPYFKAHNLSRDGFSYDPWIENGYKGKLMGLNRLVGNTLGILINVTMAEEAGMAKDIPWWGTDNLDQWTWNEFIPWMKGMSKETSDGKVERYGSNMRLGHFWDLHSQTLYSYGARLFPDGWSYENDKIFLDSPDVIESLEPLFDLVTKDNVVPDNDVMAAEGGHIKMFLGQRVASHPYHMHPLWVGQFTDHPDDVRMIPMPYWKRPTFNLVGNTMTVGSYSKLKDETAAYITAWVCDDDVNHAKMAKPFLLTTWQPQKYVDPLPEGRVKETCLLSLVRSAQSSIPRLAEDVLETPRHFGSKGLFVMNTAKAAAERTMAKSQTLTEAYTEAAAEINKELARGYN
jgi:ABC-type glycerol-3-phosphate transport system substrate-binding protein